MLIHLHSANRAMRYFDTTLGLPADSVFMPVVSVVSSFIPPIASHHCGRGVVHFMRDPLLVAFHPI
jgi:hypothetical protein